MKTYILNNEHEVDRTLYALINDKTSGFFTKYYDVINTIKVSLKVDKSPQGIESMCCILCIQSEFLSEIKIEEHDADNFASVTRAFYKAKRAIARNMDRNQAMSRFELNQKLSLLKP